MLQNINLLTEATSNCRRPAFVSVQTLRWTMKFRLKMLPPSSGCDTSYETSVFTYKYTRSHSQKDRNVDFLAARSLKKLVSSN